MRIGLGMTVVEPNYDIQDYSNTHFMQTLNIDLEKIKGSGTSLVVAVRDMYDESVCNLKNIISTLIEHGYSFVDYPAIISVSPERYKDEVLAHQKEGVGKRRTSVDYNLPPGVLAMESGPGGGEVKNGHGEKEANVATPSAAGPKFTWRVCSIGGLILIIAMFV